ncbi:unnamed protein product [Cutaneotrichosporon oleaginosum]
MPSATPLDADTYPHILDGVLAHSDYSALLILRRVSWSTKRKADARLAQHVILRMPGFGPPVSTGERYLREYDAAFCCDRVRSLTVLSCAPGTPTSACNANLLLSEPGKSLGSRPLVLSPGTAGAAYIARFPRPVLPHAPRLPGMMRWRDVATPEQEMRAERGLRVGVVMDVCLLDSRRRARKAALERCLRAIEGVRVVEVPALEAAHLARGAGFGSVDLLGVLRPEVVRYYSAWGPGPYSYDGFPHSRRRVLFAPLLKAEEGRGWFVPTGDIPVVHRETPASSSKHIVVHFTGAAAIPPGISIPQHVDRRTMASVKMVLVFSDVGGGDAAKQSGEMTGPWHNLMTGAAAPSGEEGFGDDEIGRGNPWLTATAALVAYLVRGEITLVDAPQVLGRRTEILAALETAAMQLRHGSAPPDPLRNGEDSGFASIRLLSKDEYRTEVGERMFALDMVGLARA